MQELMQYLAIASGFVAAGLGIRAANVIVRDTIEDFIVDIGNQSRWASYAAFAAGASVFLQAVDRLAQ